MFRGRVSFPWRELLQSNTAKLRMVFLHLLRGNLLSIPYGFCALA